MNKGMTEIDMDKVFKTIEENIQAIKENFDPNSFNEEERKRIILEFDAFEKKALEVRALFDE